MGRLSKDEIMASKPLSCTGIEIDNLDLLPLFDGHAVIRKAYEVLQYGYMLEFSVLSWKYIIQHYGVGGFVDEDLSSLLFESGRRSIWNELPLFNALIGAGFSKVWTGALPSKHPSILGVKAIKLKEEEVRVEG